MHSRSLYSAASLLALSALMGNLTASGEEDPATITLPEAPSFATGDFTLQTFGRVMYDYTSADADNAAGYEIDDSEWRRVRLGAKGNLTSDIKYKIELDTNSSGEIGVEDAYIEFAPTSGPLKVQIGQFNPATSLDELTSSRFSSTIERSAFTDAFDLKRRVGVAVSTKDDSYTLTAGIFGANVNSGNFDDEFSVAGRGTYNTRVNADRTLVHVGASARYLERDDELSLLRYRQRPFAHLSGRIVSTGRVASSETSAGVEGALLHDNIWAAAEYTILQADQTLASGDAQYEGGYLEAGLFLGGRRTYASGKFDRPDIDRPMTKGGLGAVSLVARYDTLDLTDGAASGGALDTHVLGAEWWFTSHAHLGVNYHVSDADLGTSTSGLDSNFAPLIGTGTTEESVEGFTVRLQFDF